MKRCVIMISIMVFAIMAVSGCNTIPKKIRAEVQGLNTRVDTLESRVEGVEGKQAKIDMSAAESARKPEGRLKVAPSSRRGTSKASITEIQTALKNANFYYGKIDGVKGKKTKRAIREFQKANGLNPDGVVGAKTWNLLSRYSASSPSSTAGDKEVK